MNKWVNSIKVGSENSRFGSRECEFTYFHGRVVRIHHANTPITTISGGGGSIHGSSFIHNGYGAGYVSGKIQPTSSHTMIKTDFNMWVRSSQNKDFSWSSDKAIDVAEGQKLTLVLLNGKMVAYVNHNTNEWAYVRTDNELADMVGQRGYLISNQKELSASQSFISNGTAHGFMLGTSVFIAFLVVVRSNFWGWEFVESESSPLWFLVPAFIFLYCVTRFGRKLRFWKSCLLALGIGIGSCFFLGERWGVIIDLFLMYGLLHKTKPEYFLYENKASIKAVKDAIFNNSNFARKNFECLR